MRILTPEEGPENGYSEHNRECRREPYDTLRYTVCDHQCTRHLPLSVVAQWPADARRAAAHMATLGSGSGDTATHELLAVTMAQAVAERAN